MTGSGTFWTAATEAGVRFDDGISDSLSSWDLGNKMAASKSEGCIGTTY